MDVRIAPSAVVEDGASIGDGTVVWDQTQVRAGASVGAACVLGRNVFVDADVVVGDRCKIQNYALVYTPARLGAGVFVGPAAVLTNDRFPRAVNADGSLKSSDDWHAAGVVVHDGASVGAGAVIVGGVTVGAWSMVGAGAVVTRDVRPFSLVVGSPARHAKWVGRAGEPLVAAGDGTWRCPLTGAAYRESTGGLEEVT